MLLQSTTTVQQGSRCGRTAGLCPWQWTHPGTSAEQPGSPSTGPSRLMLLSTDAGVRQHLEGASAYSVLTSLFINRALGIFLCEAVVAPRNVRDRCDSWRLPSLLVKLPVRAFRLSSTAQRWICISTDRVCIMGNLPRFANVRCDDRSVFSSGSNRLGQSGCCFAWKCSIRT